jgi:hypothetical protein
MSSADPVSSVPASTPPATPPHLPSTNECERENVQRRETIVERMAKLGAIKFGAPLPVNRVQPSGPTQSVEGQARRQRIAAKIAEMGDMRIAPVSTSPPPPIPVRPEEEVTPRPPRRDIVPSRQPAAYYHELEQDNEQASSSDDGVQDEAEESGFEEVGDEDLENEYDNGGVEGEKDSEDEYFYGGGTPAPTSSTYTNCSPTHPAVTTARTRRIQWHNHTCPTSSSTPILVRLCDGRARRSSVPFPYAAFARAFAPVVCTSTSGVVWSSR